MRMTVLRSAAAASVVNIVVATAAIALDQSLPAYHPVGYAVGSYQIGRVRHARPRDGIVGKGVRQFIPRRENRSGGDGVRDRAGGTA